jgi:hypothetical protein
LPYYDPIRKLATQTAFRQGGPNPVSKNNKNGVKWFK